MIDWTKPIQTEDGASVRVLATDFKANDGACVVVAVDRGEGGEVIERVNPDGSLPRFPFPCLFNVPKRRVITFRSTGEIRCPKVGEWFRNGSGYLEKAEHNFDSLRLEIFTRTETEE